MTRRPSSRLAIGHLSIFLLLGCFAFSLITPLAAEDEPAGEATEVQVEDAPAVEEVKAGEEAKGAEEAAVEPGGEGAGEVAVDGAGDGPKILTPKMRESLAACADRVNAFMKPVAHWAGKIFFVGPVIDTPDGEIIPGRDGGPITLWYVVLWLALAGVVLTLVFGFINIRGIPLAIRTIRGKYSSPDDPGEITHFQALSSAISGTVGLGNIAGVAIAISIGGPGAVFWMFVAGFLGMTTKFCECTLGVKYRRITRKGKVLGGPMYYLADGFKERQMAGLGKTLAVLFAVFCAIAAIGAGNLFQVNQALAQLVEVTGGKVESPFGTDDGKMLFGLVTALVIGVVIFFGIKGIGKVTSILVPWMCGIYVVGCLVVLGVNFAEIPAALGTIWSEAFTPAAGVGAIIIALLMGFRRAAFSNEAGFGSASIAHSAAKTHHPASEGLVALLEPFIDTVVVCTMTALVIVTTGVWEAVPEGGIAGTAQGIELTSKAFATVMPNFPMVLSLAAIVFAVSTMITWSYYGEQAWAYLFGGSSLMAHIYRLVFILFIVAGAVMSLGEVIDFADGPFFALCIINLVGVYVLLPVVREELKKYREHVKKVHSGEVLVEHAVELGGHMAPKMDLGVGASLLGVVEGAEEPKAEKPEEKKPEPKEEPEAKEGSEASDGESDADRFKGPAGGE